MTTYSSKSTAVRGAKRAGLDVEGIELHQDETGRWYYNEIGEGDEPDALMIDEKTGEMTRYSELPEDEQLRLAQPKDDSRRIEVARMNKRVAKAKAEKLAVENVAPTAEKLPAYKVLANKSDKKSSLDNPVKFIHDWLNENPDVKRKQAVTTLVGLGVNYSTARTQYQRWFAGRK